MKKIFTTAALVCALSLNAAHATELTALQQTLAAAQMADLQANAMDMINWKVGDYQKISIEMLFGKGTGTKEVTKEDTARNAVWMVSEMSILGQKQKSEALISRADGSVLEMIVNGQKQDPKDQGTIEIIEQSETNVTVPAGTFECIYVKANVTQQGQKMQVEIWANPIKINIDGSLKMVAQTQFGALTIALTEFGHK